MAWWIEYTVAALLVAAGLLALAGAVGLLRMPDFFQRMHPPALAITLGSWCVALASALYFSALEQRPVLSAWLIPVLLAITAPITSLLLARAALFRRRGLAAERGADAPDEPLPPPARGGVTGPTPAPLSSRADRADAPPGPR
ncbi:Na+/H+ antiporter subunit G [Aquincola tertiaricarbonis]|uniref:Na+/H+ antiporter subunit G n=1 Tax=Aquincola tertiaricarbonis TaxID=391953 RepID=A0ABY4S723_AQUTE|nr:Na+/H+ antiporter subunit G [Aquincola tertiaricarbonis]URI09196.1 Na+/H+ antiporter subunit G [Aquincola tertiaricarbonis]